MAVSKKKKQSAKQDVYEKAEDLPEDKRKIYASIMEDFDKQSNAPDLKSFVKASFFTFCLFF